MSPNVTDIVYKEESTGHCSVYLNRGIAKRPTRNKQSTPTPCQYTVPLSGSGYTTSMSVLNCFILRVKKLAIFY